MKHELEEYLREQIIIGKTLGKNVRKVIAEMFEAGLIDSEKQAHATLTKWDRKGIYDYGVCLDLGWFCEPEENE